MKQSAFPAAPFDVRHQFYQFYMGNHVMTVASLRDDLYGFAIELRQLAYTMPGGHEDPLIRLSERMVSQARQQAAAGESPPL